MSIQEKFVPLHIISPLGGKYQGPPTTGGLIFCTMEKQRVIVYVDGFNFYYGLRSSRQWKKYYWIDIVKLFAQFLKPNQELVCVKYFSARPTNIDKSRNQNAFFQANAENPNFKLILGKYLHKEITCFKCGNIIHTFEEKESDVRIATQIVNDANRGNCDVAIIVSADSDMLPAVELAVESGVKVFIYFPPFQHSNALANATNSTPLNLQRYESRFRASVMPDVVHLKSANFDLSIPAKWKQYQ